jgi:iron(III) transport system substrate-binding protein
VPEVRVHASVSPLAAKALVTLAASRRVARVVLVPDVKDAEVAWLGDPSEALRAPEALVPGSAPEQPDVAERWKDPWRRWFPVAARARVLLVAPRASLPSRPQRLRDLADPRLAGMQALVPFGKGEGPVTVAALASVFGEEAAMGLVAGVARARPQLAASAEEVQALVASGTAAFGLAGSEQGAAGAASAAALEVVYPDQSGFGTLVFPTAAALLPAGRSSDAARRLAEWMAGDDAERLVVARAPGYLPLRPGVPVPTGIRPAEAIKSPLLDWERVTSLRKLVAPRLEP